MGSRDSIYIGPLFIGIVIALMAAVTVFSSHAKTATPTPAVSAAPSNLTAIRRDIDSANQSPDFMRRIRQQAVATKGDFTRLPERDQRMLDSFSAGHGAQMFRSLGVESAGASQKTSNKTP